MHDQAMPPADPRAEFIAALRDLASYLTAHPSLPCRISPPPSMSSPTGIRTASGRQEWTSSPA